MFICNISYTETLNKTASQIRSIKFHGGDYTGLQYYNDILDFFSNIYSYMKNGSMTI